MSRRTRESGQDEAKTGECTMARFEILDSNTAPLGEGPAAGDMLFELGMMYSVGREMPVDLVSAHKWFNLAAAERQRRCDPAAARGRQSDVGRRDRRRATRGARLAAAEQSDEAAAPAIAA